MPHERTIGVPDRASDWAISEWSRERSRSLAALVAAALPAEDLSEDELLAVAWDDPAPEAPPGEVGVVIGASLGSHVAPGTDEVRGAAAAVIRAWGTPPEQHKIGYLKLLAVHPDARRKRLGSELLARAESWAWQQGATEFHLAGSAPFYLWPGVDGTATEMLCLIESAGYELIGSDVNMALATTFRADPPPGAVVRRVIDEPDVARVRSLIDSHWPHWWAETERAIEHGCCHGVFVHDDGAAVGFGCHSVNRAGWLGPMGTDPNHRAAGVGRALLGEICRDLMIADFSHTEVSWVGPARFYAKSGAKVSRVFRSYKKRRPTSA